MTNFMKIFGEISLQQAAEILAAEYPPCDKCAYKSALGCNAHCADGVLKWLTQETENEPVNAEEIEREAAERYGIRSQSIVAIEEMSELQKELTKLLRGECENHIDHISEEMADVYIMLGQLEILIKNHAAIDEWKDKKLRRLRDKLRKDSEE